MKRDKNLPKFTSSYEENYKIVRSIVEDAFCSAANKSPDLNDENKSLDRKFTSVDVDIIATAINGSVQNLVEVIREVGEKSGKLSWVAIGFAFASAIISAVSTIIGGAIASGGWVKLLGW